MRRIEIPLRSPKCPANNAVIAFFFVPTDITRCSAIDALNFTGLPRRSDGGDSEPAR
jgi:hypothetical protein